MVLGKVRYFVSITYDVNFNGSCHTKMSILSSECLKNHMRLNLQKLYLITPNKFETSLNILKYFLIKRHENLRMEKRAMKQ